MTPPHAHAPPHIPMATQVGCVHAKSCGREAGGRGGYISWRQLSGEAAQHLESAAH